MPSRQIRALKRLFEARGAERNVLPLCLPSLHARAAEYLSFDCIMLLVGCFRGAAARFILFPLRVVFVLRLYVWHFYFFIPSSLCFSFPFFPFLCSLVFLLCFVIVDYLFSIYII